MSPVIFVAAGIDEVGVSMTKRQWKREMALTYYLLWNAVVHHLACCDYLYVVE